MTGRARRLPATGGIELYALTWNGDGDWGGAPPVLLVHGLASNCRTWAAVGERLHRLGHPVAAVDLRGHGRSDKPSGGYDFVTLGDDLLAALDALAWDRAVVAGQSTGGNLAVDLAHRRPDRVVAVVGVDGGTIELQDRWPDWDRCAADLAPPPLAGLPVAGMVARLRRAHPAWDEAGVEATLANLEVLDDGTVRPWLTRDRHLMILRALWEHRPSKVVPDLLVPLRLLLVGGADAWPDHDLDVRWFPGADHDLHVQLPDEVAGEIHGVAR